MAAAAVMSSSTAMDVDEDAVSPTSKTATADAEVPPPLATPLVPVEHHVALDSGRGAGADPDAQATVTDFLDFTEYLPSDMVRSLTLIGKLDEDYVEATRVVDCLTTDWGRLPGLPADERPDPVRLRADISANVSRLVSSRVFSHAEAVRMSENVNRHYNRARTILTKLQTMLENYPAAEEQLKSPVAIRSPHMGRTPKIGLRLVGDGTQKVRRQRVPRITVPGEVLAPYEIDYEEYSDDSDVSTSDTGSDTQSRKTPAPRIKLVTTAATTTTTISTARKERAPRTYSSPAQHVSYPPPPDDAVIGSAELPWMQLLPYEMVRLRKRMKKNPTWEPSQSMILRELEALGRGPTAFKNAQKKAKDEGRDFEGIPPEPTLDSSTGEKQYPAGSLNKEALEAEGIKRTNRGMKLNEMKKQKKENELARLAAEEAEQSARKMADVARKFLNGGSTPSAIPGNMAEGAKSTPKSKGKTRGAANGNGKRRRDDDVDSVTDKTDTIDTPSVRPQIKRTKTETPVPLPLISQSNEDRDRLRVGSPSVRPPLTPTAIPKPHSTTPVPIPIPGQTSESIAAAAKSAGKSPSPAAGATTTTIPTKPPAETPVPPPVVSPRRTVTPIPPPVPQSTKRETRQDVAKKVQQGKQAQDPPQQSTAAQALKQEEKAGPAAGLSAAAATPGTRPTSSRGVTPRTTPAPEASALRPRSRGKAMSQEPQVVASAAADRPRRASTARNTPGPPEPSASSSRPGTATKRTKRPAPGIVSTTSSGGNSAVGRRKAAPKRKPRNVAKKAAAAAAAAATTAEPEMEEVDDEGKPIDPDEPRYCLCNRVSFGVMIQCDNGDNCKYEWFHLECVGLEDIPARTTKWYCPECRVALNIGGKGEVNSRGVKM